MLYTLGAMFSFALQNLGAKEFSRRFPEGLTGAYLLGFLGTFFGGLILVFMGNLQVESAEAVLWSVGYGVIYAVGCFLSTTAIFTGPLNIASLFANVSMVIPVVFGLFFWDESLTVPGAIGILMILATLILGSLGKGDASKPMTTKWKIVVFMSFTVNGIASIYRYYFTSFLPEASSSYMTCWALLTSAVIFAGILASCVLKGKSLKPWVYKEGMGKLLAIGGASGVGIAFGNLLTLMAVAVLPSVILYPVMQGGQIPLLWLFGIFLYKEKVNARSLVALVLGLAGIVLVNL